MLVCPCAQGRCGRCPPGSGLMSDLFFFLLVDAWPLFVGRASVVHSLNLIIMQPVMHSIYNSNEYKSAHAPQQWSHWAWLCHPHGHDKPHIFKYALADIVAIIRRNCS